MPLAATAAAMGGAVPPPADAPALLQHAAVASAPLAVPLAAPVQAQLPPLLPPPVEAPPPPPPPPPPLPPPLPEASDADASSELPLETRVTMHLARVRHFIANRPMTAAA